MRLRHTMICLMAAGAALAQQGNNASVSGTVADKTTGKLLANYTVSTFTNSTWVGNTIVQTARTKQVSSTTDSNGHYKLGDLAPGPYRIEAREAQRFGSQLERRITLAGHDLEHIDFQVVVDGTISGKVLDENKEPVPGVTVRLISREYYLGAIGYYYRGAGRTDDLGEYTINGVEPGHPYLLMAEQQAMPIPAHSEVPLDPKLRRRIPIRTWYPNSPTRDSAQSLMVTPGERRENVDLGMKKSPSYCLEGAADGAGGPEGIRFGVEPLQPSSGISNNGGTYTGSPGGTVGADGKFRICNLYPGAYRLTATQGPVNFNSQESPNFGVVPVLITDKDLQGVRVSALPGTPMEGEVVWDGPPPPDGSEVPKVSLSLSPMMRTGFNGERAGQRPDVPGTFKFAGLFADDYAVRTFLTVQGLYVKDVTYSGKSVLYEPLRAGSGMAGTGMRVIVGQDGGKVSASVHDKDGNPVGDIHVLVMMADARTEGQLAATLVQGATDQTGLYTSSTLPPGKYYFMATNDPWDYTPECIGKLWRARNRFTEVELAPKGSAQVTVEPRTIE